MIDKVTLLLDDKISTLKWSAETDAILNIDLSDCYLKPFNCIEIHFKEEITLFRNHDYTWVPITKDRIAGTFSTTKLKTYEQDDKAQHSPAHLELSIVGPI